MLKKYVYKRIMKYENMKFDKRTKQAFLLKFPLFIINPFHIINF